MKSILFFGLTLALASLALAEVPYTSIEKLRQQTIAVRVALDFPTHSLITKCHIPTERFAELGSNLQVATESEKANWKNLKLSEADLKTLEFKIQKCVFRASCSLYEELLSSVESENSLNEKIQLLKVTAVEKNKSLNSKKYLEASKKIKNLCAYLKN